MTSAKILCALLVLSVGCGDGATPSLDASLSDVPAPIDAGTDAPSGNTLSECVSDVVIDTEAVYEADRFFLLMDLSNEDLAIRMRVALSPGPLNPNVGLAINYRARALGIESSDGIACIRDESQLTYDVTHHNDTDTFTALIAPDELYSVSMIYDRIDNTFTDTHTIEHPESGAPSEGPFPLVEAGCSVHREGGVSECNYQMRAPYAD